MNIESFNKKYINVTHLIQNEFDRNIDKYGEKIKCRKGCSQCCSQIFRITQLDAFIIQKHLNEISYEKVNLFKEKAKNYLDKVSNVSNENSKQEEYLPKNKFPCPALNDDGECMIYEARPVICRRFGPPVFDYKNPDKIYACKLNFTSGEEIIDDELIPNQSLIGREWDNLKTIFNNENHLNKNASTTIAEAILTF